MKYGFAAYGYSSGERFSRPSGVFYDTNRDELYVADTGNGQIVIFDNKGIPVAKIRHFVQDQSSNERRRGEPRSVVVRKNGDILVTDNLCDYLDVLDFQGRSVEKIRPAQLLEARDARVKPGCLAIDGSGTVYMSVSGDVNAILVLDSSLKLKSEIGKIGSAGAFKAITGLWVDDGGKIYATYAQGECVRVYGPDGKLLMSFGTHDSGPENFSLPSGVTTDRAGNIWAVDTLRHTVSIFKPRESETGKKVSLIDSFGGFGNAAGQLAYPTAIAGDGSSRVYVLEGTGARVQAFEVLFDERTGNAQ